MRVCFIQMSGIHLIPKSEKVYLDQLGLFCGQARIIHVHAILVLVLPFH